MYSKELIKEVKECYPDCTAMHELAENGNVWLGRYLDDSRPNGVPFDTVLTALTLDELQDIARIGKRKIKLYRDWNNECGR